MDYHIYEADGRNELDEKIKKEHPGCFVQMDATRAYKNYGSPTISTKSFDNFIREYTANFLKAPGTLACITLRKAVKNTRMNPYSIKNNVAEGRRRFEKAYIVWDENHNAVARIKGTKANALDIVRGLYTSGKLTKNVKVEVIHEVAKSPDGDDYGKYVFEAEYTPTLGTCTGEYIVFGNFE